jgi:hypothetical protein
MGVRADVTTCPITGLEAADLALDNGTGLLG